MAMRDVHFIYAAPARVEPTESSWAKKEQVRAADSEEPLTKRYARMFADQMQLPADSLLRRDLIDPFTYDNTLPAVQAEMAAGIKDFSAAADQICTAIREGKTIGISSDYDADGNTSLALFIRLLRTCGVPSERIIEHIPNRDQDGYGVNESAVDDFIGHHVDLMITLDNGTRAEKPVSKALAAGMEVIVIDHHGDAGGKALPSQAKVVNPNILANAQAVKASPYLEESKSLAAVGVSYMMAAEVMARISAERPTTLPLDPKPLLGLAAIGTVSDVVPMGWLNRLLVREGLARMRQGEDKNILRFMRGAGIADPTSFTESDIAFRLGPIINAPGRLGDSVAWAFLSAAPEAPSPAVLQEGISQTIEELNQVAEALKTDAQKKREASLKAWKEKQPLEPTAPHALYDTIPSDPFLEKLIHHSVECNEQRKDIEFLMRPEIRAAAKKQSNMPIRVLAGEGWHEGIIGIAASRVKEELGLPAVIGSIKQHENGGWQAKFSARSIRVPGWPVDIGAAFAALGPQHADDDSALLAKAGGHPMAAGATIVAATREELQDKIDRFATELSERIGADTVRAVAARSEQVYGTLDFSKPQVDAADGKGSFTERLHRLVAAMPSGGPYGEALRAPLVAIRGVGIYPPQAGRGESRRGHLNFDIMGDHNPLRIHCRASHAGGTAMADQLQALQHGLCKGIIVGQLVHRADGSLQMEVEHVLPDNGMAADPAFRAPGIFGLAGLNPTHPLQMI